MLELCHFLYVSLDYFGGSMYMSGQFFWMKKFKRFLRFLRLPTLKVFLICSSFFTNFSLFVLTKFVLIKKCIIFLEVLAVHRFFIHRFSCWGLRLKWQEIKQLLSTAHAKIVPRLTQLRLKLTTSQPATLLVGEYQTDRQNSSWNRKEKTFEN